MTKYAIIIKKDLFLDNEEYDYFYEVDEINILEALRTNSKIIESSIKFYRLSFNPEDVELVRISENQNIWFDSILGEKIIHVIKVDKRSTNTGGWYSFIFFYMGGTYIAQFHSNNLDEALDKWMKYIEKKGMDFIPDINLSIISKFKEMVFDNGIKPELANNCSHIYHKKYLIYDKRWFYGQLIVVKTDVEINDSDDENVLVKD